MIDRSFWEVTDEQANCIHEWKRVNTLMKEVDPEHREPERVIGFINICSKCKVKGIAHLDEVALEAE